MINGKMQIRRNTDECHQFLLSKCLLKKLEQNHEKNSKPSLSKDKKTKKISMTKLLQALIAT
jgi:hypothetical protein